MELKLLFSMIVIMFSSWVSLSYSQLGDSSMPCIQKLLPCQPYLTSPSSPPSSCCLPLKEMITDDSKCLCDVFNNPDLLKSLNLTQENALKLPKACGAVVDLSVCKTDTTPPTVSPSTPTTPSTTPSTGSPPGGKNTTTSSTSKISLFGGYGFLVLVSSLFVRAL